MPCNCCEITDRAFSENEARSEIRRYRRKGPPEQTRLLLNAIRSLRLRNISLLDIGGGIGVIHHELLEDVADTATHVDASSAYLKEAKGEAARRGHSDRVTFIHGDYTEVAAEIPRADVVTLDRVVCCYPDFRRLLKNAADHSQGALALTYPRETWYLRVALKFMNFFQQIRRDPFRVFLHPVSEMDLLLSREGFERVTLQRLFVWEIALYQRSTV